MTIKCHLLQLPNELVLYITRHFLDLSDLWCIYCTNSKLRYFASTILKSKWRININNTTLIKLQCRVVLISLSSIATKLSTSQQQSDLLMKREQELQTRIIHGILSYKHKFVLIEDIDIRNRIKSIIDIIFHHGIFVSCTIYQQQNNVMTTRILATMLVELLTKLDTTFTCNNEIYIVENIKTFLEFTEYKLIADTKSCNIILYNIWACFDFMGAAFIDNLIDDIQIQAIVKRTCKLLCNFKSFKKSLLLNFLNHWLKNSTRSDLISFIQLEIEK